jgi:hypothetical protein
VNEKRASICGKIKVLGKYIVSGYDVIFIMEKLFDEYKNS